MRLCSVFFVLAIVVSSLCSQSLSAGVIDTTLNGLKISFDEQTGCIVRMEHPSCGVILESSQNMNGLLDVAYPIQAFVPMRLASRYSRAKLTYKNDEVTITWDRLAPSRQSFDLPKGNVEAEVTLTAAPDQRSIIMKCRIENHSAGQIPQVLFPDFQGLRPFEGVNDTRLRLSRAVVNPFTESLYGWWQYQGFGWKEYRSWGYASENPLRWLDLGGYRSGLSVFQKKWGTEDQPTVMFNRLESDATRVRLTWQHVMKPIDPGQTWESGEFWLTPHGGGWAKGIEVFNKYVKQVNPLRDIPRHVRDGLGCRTAWLMTEVEQEADHAAFKYKDIPDLARDAEEHGLQELVLWGWGHVCSLPIQTREELGSRQDFVDAVREAKRLGVNVSPFITVQLLVKPQLERYGVDPGSASSVWAMHPDFIPKGWPYYISGAYPIKYWEVAELSPTNKLWQVDVLKSLTEWINSGVCSVGWDVCKTKGGKDGCMRMFEKVRDLARAKDPESTFCGESVDDLEQDSLVLDYTWNGVDYVDAGPVLNVLRTPRINCLIDDSVDQVKAAFCDGLYLNLWPRKPDQPNGTALIREKPELSATLKQCASLRKQFLPYFTEGTFIGDSVLIEPTSAFVRGHVLGKKMLVFVLNNQGQPQSVKVKSDLSLWISKTKEYKVKYYNAVGKLLKENLAGSCSWEGRTLEIRPGELCAFEIEAGSL